ncbi:M28 family peptidase [Roseomonas sp. E05]|uniref:M28 family peptidase n=1 Tax=Roseomonas sp. E05 TaxID=3046310 RepID=UPI0024BB62B3|nr:M28 family peptidase [Roseomonas sp. E05]MDJ0390755.1 M28 family peptidase [Roseomonas sp. E05]
MTQSETGGTPRRGDALPTRPEAAGIDGAAMHRIVADLAAMGRKLPGSPAEARACDYITGLLARAGIRHAVHEFDAFISWPERSAVTLLGETPRDFAASGVGFAAPSPEEGLRAPLGEGQDLAGRIALVDGLPRYDAVMAAQRGGAVGVIAVSHGPERHYVQTSPIWGAPTGQDEVDLLPRIPVVQVSREDGAALRAAGAGAEVRLLAESRREWRRVRMPCAEIPGREPHFVLLGAHYCTWADGATDNLAGVALLLELARLYAAGETPRYGLRFGWWTGHEQGGYAGSSWYADQFRTELHDNAIAYLNVDIVGVKGATTKALRNTTGELAAYAAAVLEATAGPLPEAEEAFVRRALKRQDKYVDPRRSARNSDQSFSGIGLATAQVSAFLPAASPEHMPGSGLAWWWQTEQDTADRCDPAILAADTLIYRNLVEGLVNPERLPLDYAGAAEDILAALREYAEAAPDLPEIGWLAELATRFREAAAQLAASPAVDTARQNALLLRLGRHLNPMMHHARSDFDFDLGRASRLLPGLAPALTLKDLAPDAARMARTLLRRRANRIAHGLLRAEEAIGTALA